MRVLDSTRNLKKFTKQTFAIKNGDEEVVRHTLLVNPEDMSVNEPAKVTVTETLGGGYVSDFGSAFKTVSIQGTTGYRARYNADGELRDGYTEFVHFRSEVYRKFLDANEPKYAMYWYNWEDEEYYRIQPTNFRLMRNKSEPLLYRYELQFTCLEKLGAGGTKPKFSQSDIAELNLVKVSSDLASSISSMSEVVTNFS
jgi:hypothetical protein